MVEVQIPKGQAKFVSFPEAKQFQQAGPVSVEFPEAAYHVSSLVYAGSGN